MAIVPFWEQYLLGARMIEKHFTLSNKLEGPDHKFSMNPKTWLEMRSKDLEN